MVCGCEVLVIVAIPAAAAAAWPVVVAAATAATSALGFVTAKTLHEGLSLAQAQMQEEQAVPEVDLPVAQAEAVTQDLVSGQELHFHKEGVDIIFCHNLRGRAGVRVRGLGKTRQELEAVGQAFCQQLAQNYAYHRVVTKLRQQHFHIVDEDVKDNGTVHIQARIYRDEA
jgi:hypothetical protein